MLRQQQHQIHLLPITILLSVISIASAQQFNNNDGTFWRDAFRLGFSYDPLDLLGPARWSAVGSSNNNNQNNNNFLQSRDQNWGEWDYVGRLATMDNDDEDAPVLLNFQENECGSEAYPSPIELIPTSACTDEREMKTRQFNPFIDCMHPKDNDIRGDDEITQPWEITPYSLRYYYPRTDRVCRRPSLRLDQMWTSNGKNEEHFSLLWLELHARSEHVVNGQRYDAELQMVHMGTTRPNELVVVSVMIQADATQDHTDFQNYLLDGWQRKAARERYLCRDQRTLQRERAHLRRGGNQEGDGKDDKSEHDVYQQALYEYAQAMNTNNHQFDDPEPRRRLKEEECVPDKYGHGCEAQGLGPRKRTFPYSLWPSVWYYSYTGSLTAPPCAGQVHWRIIDTPLYVVLLACCCCCFVLSRICVLSN